MNKTPYTPYYSQTMYAIDKHQEGTIVYTDNGVIQQEPVKGEIVVEQAATSGEENGHQWIDLGLPSGTKWATMNVGASSETDYGNYYMYGKGADTYQVTSSQSNYSGTENPLAASADTATQVWGGQWHMPTKEQCEELINNTTYEWVLNYQDSGINGSTFTANGQTLFIPAASVYNGNELMMGYTVGVCLSSTPDGSDSYCLHFDSTGAHVYNLNSRSDGDSVRPVLNPQS